MLKKKITYKILQGLLVAILVTFFVIGIINFNENRLYNIFQLAILLFLVVLPLVNFIILIIKEANFLSYDINKHFLYASVAILVYSAFFSIFLGRIVAEDTEAFLALIAYEDFFTVFHIFLFLLITGCVSCIVITKKPALKHAQKEKEIQQKYLGKK